MPPTDPPVSNNTWYLFNNSDSVIVFVHGIFSGSATCWLYRGDNGSQVFWPKLVTEDPRILPVSIFMGGFYTGPESRAYDIRACASELLSALKRVDPTGLRPAPIEKKRLIFVCHSTGGIVVRYMLESDYAQFASKEVGLALIASPSYGSSLADTFRWISRLYNHKLMAQLEWGNWSIEDLDDRFKNLLAKKLIPQLKGAEAYENLFIVRRKWLPSRRHVVEKQSAGRYFAAPRLLRGTDHFSSVKPDSLTHPAHEFLFDFLSEDYPDLVVSDDFISQLNSRLSPAGVEFMHDHYGKNVIAHSGEDDFTAATINELLEKRLIEEQPKLKDAYAFTSVGKAVSERIKSNLIEKKKKIGSRYYVYISDSKIDMLFSQISSTPESNRYKKADEVIKHIYDTEKVGTIDAPSEYFHGTLDMRWGPYGDGFYRYQRADASEETSPLAYFSGHRDRTLVALCGSTKHLIGLDLGELGKTHAHSYSITPMIETFFRRKLDLDPAEDLDEMGYLGNSGSDLVYHLVNADRNMQGGPAAKLEFLARTLMSWREPGADEISESEKIHSMVLGTPIYVALAR
ncbi:MULTISPECIES: DUF7019 family protein [Bradyrhizobium]|uniref:DUF7019 family protein n=1 Tax=Bradyrhizobium TaxID=374 RepID=UPI0003FBF648|nr:MULTISPECIES: SAVMC3_10250 family protein [Bradyrhizobium]UFW51139.1 hypothetical protein BaraCB756_08955 [Bradyrhizobium arachidis]